MDPSQASNVGLLAGINVGFDLHDKFFDVLPKFQEILTMRTGVTVPLQRLRKELILLEGSITLEQYNDAKELLFEQPYFFRQVSSMPGAAARVVDFHRQGARLPAITASGEQALRNIKNWDKHHGELRPHVTIHSSGLGGSKAELAKRFQIHYFSDNKLKNIIELRRIVPRLVFFRRPNNWHEVRQALKLGARVIDTWNEYYDYVLEDAPRLREELADAAVGRVRSMPSRKRDSEAPPDSGVVIRVNTPLHTVDQIINECLFADERPTTPMYSRK
jgi:hypothetical protein